MWELIGAKIDIVWQQSSFKGMQKVNLEHRESLD